MWITSFPTLFVEEAIFSSFINSLPSSYSRYGVPCTDPGTVLKWLHSLCEKRSVRKTIREHFFIIKKKKRTSKKVLNMLLTLTE
jgi:hypothetical protein